METQPVKPVEPQQAPVVVKEKMKSRPAVVILSVLLLVALVGAGLLSYVAYGQMQTINNLNDSIDDLSYANSLHEGKNSDTAESTRLDMSAKGQEIRAGLAASQYYCVMKNFGCDKVSNSVTKLQAATATSAGFAIVTAVSGPGLATKLYVKSSTGADWVVIFDGQNVPPTDVVDKFAIPDDFVN